MKDRGRYPLGIVSVTRKYTSMWPLFLAVVLASPLHTGGAGATPAAREHAGVDPMQLYGSGLDFDVYRNGDKVGIHRVRFVGSGEAMTAVTEFRVRIEFLFFTAYRYDYRSVDRWQGGSLAELKAEVDDDGTVFSVEAVREGPLMSVRGTGISYTVDSPLIPTNHWNPLVLRQTRVLNTLTGRVNRVAIEPREREVVPADGGTIIATRYVYTGDLDNEVWYDDAGRWVKMRFKGKDGSLLDYVCRRCLGYAAATQAQ
jgi:Family of unknown function (DUF6134)